MTIAPTIQMIWFTVRFLLLLITSLCTIAWAQFRCVSERSPDNPGGFELDKSLALPVNICHVLLARGQATVV
jgi:hypothetical protein